MTHEPTDLSKYFEGTDIGIDITCWKQENRDFWMYFLPLELNDMPQDALQKINNEVTRLHFTLIEKNDKLHIYDLTTKRGWHLDTTEVRQGRLRLVGDGQGVIFVRQAVVDLGSLIDEK